MADGPDQDSKTFDPTPRRLKKAREEGQVAKSNEVSTAATIIVAAIALTFTGEDIMAAVWRSTQTAFRRAPEAQHDLGVFTDVSAQIGSELFWAFLPFMLLTLLAAVGAHVAQAGFLFSPKSLVPKPERLNVFSKLPELVNPATALMRTLVAILKIGFVGIVVYTVVIDDIEKLRTAATIAPGVLLKMMAVSTIKIMFAAGLTLTTVAVIDFTWQKHKHIKQLKMTHDEIKRENKEEEGSPEIKGRRKSLYRELTLNRVLEEVPKADVIVTNPTHFAVALRYDTEKDMAPRVVAKGVDQMALTIRRIARRNGVLVVENRPLARTLWRKVKVGRVIPLNMYEAVAAVLAHVYRLRGKTARVAS